MSNFLNLPDFHEEKIKELSDHYLITAELIKQPTLCPHCGHNKAVSYGFTYPIIKDLPIQSKPVQIKLQRRRYRCQSCIKTFSETVKSKHHTRGMTLRLIDYIEQKIGNYSLSFVAAKIGVNEKTVRNIAKDYKERLKKNSQKN